MFLRPRFDFFRPAQNFVAHTKPKETFVVKTARVSEMINKFSKKYSVRRSYCDQKEYIISGKAIKTILKITGLFYPHLL